MIHGLHVDVLLGATYAVFLVVVAAILERVALHSHRLSRRIEVAGFKYHTVHDRWECPTGEYLERHQTNHRLGIVTYRAPAHACNACHCRGNCTDSEDGRRIEYRLDSWLQSELRRFHRGLSLLLLLLAGLILAAQMSTHDTSRDWLVIVGLLLPIATLGRRLLTLFWRARQPKPGLKARIECRESGKASSPSEIVQSSTGRSLFRQVVGKRTRPVWQWP